ncbi:MAG: hypothetical protein COA70_09015 [Planctomycetota bacterium]|nr:MAG: hypothetical protein COA70_09015 [Planctomycetota bacterium]
MKRGLFVWLPQAESLDPTPPAGAMEWANRHGCSFATWEQWESKHQHASFVVTVCSSQQVDWLPQLFGKLAQELLVYGPDAATKRYFDHGVLRLADDFSMPSSYDGPMPLPPEKSTVSDFFCAARQTGWSPELAVLCPMEKTEVPFTAWVALEGADGAGKSTQAAKLKLALGPSFEPKVLRSCRSGSFYQEVSQLLQASVLQGDSRGWRWGRLWKIFDSLRLAWGHFQTSSKESLVWDRYFETHLAATRMRFGDDCGFRALMDSAPACAAQVYLDLPEADSSKRREQRVASPTLDEHDLSQRRYRQAFRAQSRLGRMHSIEAGGSVEDVQKLVSAALQIPSTTSNRDVATVLPPQWEQEQSCSAIQLWSSMPSHLFAPSPDQDVGMDWAGFLRAMEHAGEALTLADRIDVLALELQRRAKAESGCLRFPLWPPLLRAIHGLSPSYEPANLCSQLQWSDSSEIASDWKMFFASELAQEEYLRRANTQQNTLEVSGVLLLNENGEVFLEQRHPEKSLYPNRWDSPGGKLEPQESPLSAAQREMEEEYGILANLSAYQFLHSAIDFEPTTGRRIKHHIFVLHFTSLPLTLGPDAISMAWVLPADALENQLLANPLREALLKLSTFTSPQTRLIHDATL